MKFLIYAILFIALASLVLGIVTKLIGMIVFAALVVVGILFVAKLLRGSRGAPY